MAPVLRLGPCLAVVARLRRALLRARPSQAADTAFRACFSREEVCIRKSVSGKAMNAPALTESWARASFSALTKKPPRPKAEGVVRLLFLARERVCEVSVVESAPRALCNLFLSIIRAFRVGN